MYTHKLIKHVFSGNLLRIKTSSLELWFFCFVFFSILVFWTLLLGLGNNKKFLEKFGIGNDPPWTFSKKKTNFLSGWLPFNTHVTNLKFILGIPLAKRLIGKTGRREEEEGDMEGEEEEQSDEEEQGDEEVQGDEEEQGNEEGEQEDILTL